MDEVKLEPCPFDGSRDIKLCCAGIGRYYHHCGLCNVQTETRATPELAAEAWNRRQPQSAEWVPWKEGDPKPAGNERCIVTHTAHGAPAVGLAKPSEFGKHACPVIAYIPQRLPDPYTDAQGKRDEK